MKLKSAWGERERKHERGEHRDGKRHALKTLAKNRAHITEVKVSREEGHAPEEWVVQIPCKLVDDAVVDLLKTLAVTRHSAVQILGFNARHGAKYSFQRLRTQRLVEENRHVQWGNLLQLGQHLGSTGAGRRSGGAGE